VVESKHRLLTTVAYRLDGRTTYALEGSIFIAGAAVQWLRDGLGIIDSAQQTQAMAEGLESNDGVYLVPAFVGLGAPHWDSEARATLTGLTRGTGPAQLARAALEAVCYQTHDLAEAMRKDGAALDTVRIDGGMVGNDWLAQYLADILGLPVERPAQTETTALGAAYLAGLQTGVYAGLDDLSANWRSERRFEPSMALQRRSAMIDGWQEAVGRTLSRS